MKVSVLIRASVVVLCRRSVILVGKVPVWGMFCESEVMFVSYLASRAMLAFSIGGEIVTDSFIEFFGSEELANRSTVGPKSPKYLVRFLSIRIHYLSSHPGIPTFGSNGTRPRYKWIGYPPFEVRPKGFSTNDI